MILSIEKLLLGTASSTTGIINLPAGTTTADGINFGADGFLYRSAAGRLLYSGAAGLSISASAVSTSTTSGAVIITGGLGVGGATYLGGVLDLTANAGTTKIQLGTSQSIDRTTSSNVTINGNGTVTLNTGSGTMVFTGAGGLSTSAITATWNLYNTSDAAGLTIGTVKTSSPGTCNFIQTTSNSGSSPYNVYGNLAIGSQVGGSVFIARGNLRVLDTTASTSTTSGSFIAAGGAAVAGALYVGGLINGASTLNITGNFTIGTTLVATGIVSSKATASSGQVSNGIGQLGFQYDKIASGSTAPSTTVDLIRFTNEAGSVVGYRCVCGTLNLIGIDSGNGGANCVSKTYSIYWTWAQTSAVAVINTKSSNGTDPFASVSMTIDSSNMPKITGTTAGISNNIFWVASFSGIVTG